MKLNTCLLACAVRVSLRRAFKRKCLYLVSYIRLRSRFNIKHVCLCFAAQGRCGKPRSQELQHPGGTGLSSEESWACLAPAELLGIFHGWSPVFHRKHAHYALQLCLPKTVYCGHVVVLPLWGRTADTSLPHNNSYPFKSSWLKYINPPFFSCLWIG